MVWARAALAAPSLLPTTIILATFFRVFRIGDASLWVDEGFTLAHAALPLSAVFGDVWQLESNPPGYYLLLRPWLALAGDSEWALRLPSALAGVAAVIAQFAYARRAFGADAGLVAGLLSAVWVPLLIAAQDGRAYALLHLAVCAGLLAAHGLAEAASERRRIAAPFAMLACCGGAAIWLHVTGVIAVAALGAYVAVLLLRSGAGPGRALLLAGSTSACAALLALPWLIVALRQAMSPAAHIAWIPKLDGGETLALYWATLATPPSGRFRRLSGFLILAAGAACLSCRWRGGNRAAPALASALLVVLLLFPAASLITPILLRRTLLFATAFSLPLVAGGISLARPRFAILLIAAFIAAVHARSALQVLGQPEGREDWRGAIAAAVAAARPGDILLAGGHGSLESHYLSRVPRPEGSLPPALVIVASEVPLVRAMQSALGRSPSLPAELPCASLPGTGRVFVVSRTAPGGGAIASRLLDDGARPVAPRRAFKGVVLDILEPACRRMPGIAGKPGTARHG